LLLGLLVASAKSSYDAQSAELTQMAANLILVDRGLAHYGPEAQSLRDILKIGVSQTIDQLWSKKGNTRGALPTQAFGEFYDKLLQLEPHSSAQHMLQSQLESIITNVGQTGLLLLAQSGASVSTVFLVVIVFWLSLLFVSFGLFAPRNATAITTLFLAAVSVAGALFLVLELDHPFSGLIQVSSEPLRTALAVLRK
jgi:hypothetical protein